MLPGASWRAIVSVLAALAIFVPTGCGEETPDSGVLTETTPTATAIRYQRQAVDFYRGIAEPRADAWQDMARDSGRLLEDGFNTVTLSPPVLITARLGGQPRVILEGEAASAETFTEVFHEKGLAVHLAPTTQIAGLSEQQEPTASTLSHLEEDVLRWSEKAELSQAELFSPLSRYNLVLGTDAANRWSAKVLPLVKQRYHGPLAAKVTPDLGDPPAPGGIHDFEKLNLRGYDFLMIDIYPRGERYDPAAFQSYVNDVLSRAAAVAQRDGLKGIMVEFGGWRKPAGADGLTGPLLGGEEGQAQMAELFLEAATPRTQGIFFNGWTLPGRGAKDFRVEEVLKRYFSG